MQAVSLINDHIIKETPTHFPVSALLAASVSGWLDEPLAKPGRQICHTALNYRHHFAREETTSYNLENTTVALKVSTDQVQWD